MLHLLLVDLDLDRVLLLVFLALAVPVAKVCALLVQLALRDLPERVDLVALELEVVALLALAVEFILEAQDLSLELQCVWLFRKGKERGWWSLLDSQSNEKKERNTHLFLGGPRVDGGISLLLFLLSLCGSLLGLGRLCGEKEWGEKREFENVGCAKVQ